ncbi:MAG: D-2-hydroxyacid dehydrogenase [Proteobacteria bacterium]|nr:MAG: D-2-hydroxyacid dehydrogenase [Pseudomonadota bacterium]
MRPAALPRFATPVCAKRPLSHRIPQPYNGDCLPFPVPAMRVVLSATLAKAQFVARLEPLLGADLTVVEGEQAIVAAVPRADALLLTDFLYTKPVADAVRAAVPRLKWLQLLTAGYDSAKQFGVPPDVTVTNMGDALAAPVATHAVMLLLALQRLLPAAMANQNLHIWDRSISTPAVIPDQSTIAVVGFGHIGREIARLLRAFGARIIAITRSGTPHALADETVGLGKLLDVLPRADAVMIAVPLDASTQGLFGSRALNACKHGAFLVNIARGSIVDSFALIEALTSGVLAGAGLDVTDPEPLPKDHPLWGAPNLIITPHFAGACGVLGTQRMAAIAEDNIKRFMRGDALTNVVRI